ncbi:hypothetical protein [Parvularcula dongshanensis]|uniref:Peptidase M10 metallopeptidase domain-containing protein n=1 Tax=Parvularcula dongshanensis TaxID=1173995 RepID=A0A840HZY2_9PROT|nr:hypothetical protein [Parvularcula dongshanensis]MBB4657591.1 hypothetical protein [Parvularcula dongshanensis]
MKSLLTCAAVAALLCGMTGATAAPKRVTKTELKSDEVLGYRIQNDECVPTCDTAKNKIRKAIAARAAASAQDEEGANAPRADFSADSVRFQGSGRAIRRTRTAPQVIYLKFDNTGSPIYPVDVLDYETGEFLYQLYLDDYVFTPQDRAAIRDRVAADYAPFDIEIVTTPPASGPYATIDYTLNDYFSDGTRPGGTNITLYETDSGSYAFNILFGQAQGIDFGNDDYATGAFSDVNFWNLLYNAFSPGTFGALSGLSPDEAGYATAIRNQAANTGAHEVGHAVGLRHHDSFGAPDDGLPSTGVPAPGTFIPVYEGPQDGDEAILHLMASGASVGLPLAGSANQNRFFSERSALKLLLAEDARIADEAALADDKRAGAKRLDLKRTMVPNTIVEGKNAGGKYVAMDTAWVQGSLDGIGDSDEFVFTAKRSMFINAELISFSDTFIENPVIAYLNLYKVERNGSRTLVSQNAQTFEPYDPLLVDIEVPSYGQYVLEVLPQPVAYVPNGDGTFFPIPLDTPENRTLLQGDYDLIVYQVDRPIGNAPFVDAQ